MPILTGIPPTAGPAPSPPAKGVVQASAQWTWTTAAGTVRNLSAGDVYLRPGGVVGHVAPPVTVTDTRPPTATGGVYAGSRREPRDIGLGLVVSTEAAQQWAAAASRLAADLDTTDGAGVLTVHHPNGMVRAIQCRYVGGMESPDGGDPGVVPVGSFTVQMRAYDPYWYEPVQNRMFTVATDRPLWPAAGGPPFTIMPTELVGSPSTISNPGDMPAYPVWTVTGPCTAVSLTGGANQSTLTVTHTLDDGGTLVVDTDPRVSPFGKIVDGSGTNLWGTATGDYPDLWALPAGQSQVTVAVAGASAATSVLMQFNPRHRSYA